MDNSILVAVITVSGSILVAAITFFLTKKHQRDEEWRHEKLNHYKELLSAMFDTAIDGIKKNDDVQMRFSRAFNTIALVASQDVVAALMKFHDEITDSNPNKSPEEHDKLLRELMMAIRKDIGLLEKDDKEFPNFHLMGRKPK